MFIHACSFMRFVSFLKGPDSRQQGKKKFCKPGRVFYSVALYKGTQGHNPKNIFFGNMRANILNQLFVLVYNTHTFFHSRNIVKVKLCNKKKSVGSSVAILVRLCGFKKFM